MMERFRRREGRSWVYVPYSGSGGILPTQSHCDKPVSRAFTLELQVEDDFMESNNKTIWLRIEGDRICQTDAQESRCGSEGKDRRSVFTGCGGDPFGSIPVV